MKKVILFLLIFLFGKIVVAQDVLDTPVEIHVKKKSIELTLKELQSNYPIFFSYGKLNLSRKKTINFKGSLRKALFKIFEGENVTWTAIEDQIVLKYTRIKGQPIRGLILDEDSQTPLIGANILIKNTSEFVGASTDLDGYFTISNLIVGRYDLEIQYIGYETFYINQVLVTSGKDVFLNINLKESILALEEVVIVAELQKDLTEPLNDMSTVSARSFSVEQTQRYAASIADPARIAQSFAGVAGGGDDLSNEIIIRGNSTRGLLWMVEGVEVPNPNHFADYVSNGGSVNMISAFTLADSDFYTGAFPAEYGNALSGVFDLRMRNGNKEKREHKLSFGLLGLDLMTEGYFSKKSNASYLVNARYSTLGLLERFLESEEGSEISYRDFNIKLNFPTKKAGQFSIFSIGGKNFQGSTATKDSTQWNDNDVTNGLNIEFNQKVGIIGMTHRYLLSDRSYLKSSIIYSDYSYYDLTQQVIPWADYLGVTIDETKNRDYGWGVSTQYNLKINARNTIRTGGSLQKKKFAYDFISVDEDDDDEDVRPGFDSTLVQYLENSGSTEFLQAYFQWQNRFARNWELNTGVHCSYLFLNGTYSIDPRIGLKWRFRKDKSLALAFGFHSKPEQISTYFIEKNDGGNFEQTPNKNMEMLKAIHLVGGYHQKITPNLRLMVEAYYQHLYNIPVSINPDSEFSILNGTSIFNIIFANDFGASALVNEGTGMNYGIDLTLEKFFSQNYYFLLTSSLFDSKYTTLDGRVYRTRYASNYLLNLLGGKEWMVGRQKKYILGTNLKFTYNGGLRYTPIDLEASIMNGGRINIPNRTFTAQVKPYIRLDLGISFKINLPNTTHSFLFDIQNVLDYKNIDRPFYNSDAMEIQNLTQNGIIPFVTYRWEFSGKEK